MDPPNKRNRPRPIADTLGYHSVIAHNADFEKCSTAPLPCTPYLPGRDIRLRRASAGLAAGFVRVSEPDLAGRVATCIGELSTVAARPIGSGDAAEGQDGSGCRPNESRDAR